ncbi:wd40 repeat-containing protein [Leptolyngbya sp. Heron Island J]|uniref:serine/threonine-protein kinase n=1 Tax=Leptolyngbya sp. Heron Island J TaxID=1385935 RepID=UPI0003B95C84|nr:serine/threonine-protein kinase [Leptolyngbya sp. Heron Island J]ESA35690.1 wd40 repeat-containing protein [Leptolyngbya sp. Heron Island J]
MSLCINPDCPRPDHPGNGEANSCQACGTPLILQGRYRVMRLLSNQTGFGLVYEAYERALPKILKVLRNEHSQTPKIVSMFQQEASALSQLNHPGVPYMTEDGYFTVTPPAATMPLHCIVMEKIDGINLTQWMKQQGSHPIHEQQALRWLTQLTEILKQVHQNHYFHRDIKPENVMIRTSGQLALVDFGAAREVTPTYLNQVSKGGIVTAISSAGYTPPEQEQGQAVPQSDFYALGRTLIYLLTAKAPTDAELYDPLENQFEWRSYAPQISTELADLLDSMIAPRVVDRPASAQAILTRLKELSGQSAPSRPLAPTLPETTLTNSTTPANEATSLQLGITTPSWQTLPQTMLPPRSRRRWPWMVAALVGVLAVGAIAVRYQLLPAKTAIQAVEPTPLKVQLHRTLPAHTSSINDLLLFADGLRLVSASADKTIRVWDLTSGQVLQIWSNQTSFVNTILLNPDETRLYSGNADGSLQAWAVANGSLIWQNNSAHNGPVNTVARTPDGQQLISGGADGAIHIWEASTGKAMDLLLTQQGAVNSLVVTSDGQYIISGGSDNTIKVWHLATGELKETLKGHESFVNALTISPDGRYLFSASADATIRQWQIKTGELLNTLSGHTSYVNDMVFSRDGRLLRTASADQTVRIWNVETGAAEQVLTGFDMLIDHIVVSPSEHIVGASRTTPAIKIWLKEQ